MPRAVTFVHLGLMLAQGFLSACGGRVGDGEPVDASPDSSVGADVAVEASADVGALDSGPEAPLVCGAGLSTCGGNCVDTKTDNSHCGGCGIVCAGVCFKSRCVVKLVPLQAIVNDIAINSTELFFAYNAVGRVPLSGGVVTDVPGSSGPITVALSSSHVYWGVFSDTGLSRAPLLSGPTEIVNTQYRPSAIALDGQYAYVGSLFDALIYRVPVGGGPLEILATFAQGPQFLLLDGGDLYWGFHAGGAPTWISRMSTSGGAITKLVDAPATVFQITMSAGTLYWAASDGIYSMPKGGGPIFTVAKAPPNERLAIDDKHAYFPSGNSLMKVPLAGGAPEAIASATQTYAVAVDATSVYFSAVGGVFKVTPK